MTAIVDALNVVCDTCGAKAGRRCFGGGSSMKLPHAGRFTKARKETEEAKERENLAAAADALHARNKEESRAAFNAAYPQHVKLESLGLNPRAENDVVGDFLDWLEEKGIHLAEYDVFIDGHPDRLYPSMKSKIDLVGEFFEIDHKALQAEKGRMLDYIRTHPGGNWPLTAVPTEGDGSGNEEGHATERRAGVDDAGPGAGAVVERGAGEERVEQPNPGDADGEPGGDARGT